MDRRYIAARRSKKLFQYGIQRRAEALLRHFQPLDLPPTSTVLDVGTADGRVLQRLQQRYGFRCIGVDIRRAYLTAARGVIGCLVQADGRALPLPRDSVDVVVSTAALKHIEGVEQVVEECHRVLRPGGILAIVDPTPLGIRLGLLLGHFPPGSIFHVLSLGDLQEILVRHGFTLISRERFMLAPWPLPGSRGLERLVKRLGLEGLLLNQIVCARRL